MTIIATARVPRRSDLRDADTVRLVKPMASDQNGQATAKIDETGDVDLAALGATVTAMPVVELAAHLGISLTAAVRARALYAAAQPCPDWCTSKGQHPADEDPEDLTHWGGTSRVALNLEKVFGGENVEAYASLVQHSYDEKPRVNAFLGVEHPVDMTPAEARAYAALLVELADAAEQAGSSQ